MAKKNQIPEFVWESFEQLVKFREFSSIRDIIMLKDDVSNSSRASTLHTYFLYRAANRHLIAYNALTDVILIEDHAYSSSDFQLEPTVENTDPTVCRLYREILKLQELSIKK